MSIEYKIQFRMWSYASSLYNSFWEHFRCWCFGKWNKENTCDLWEDSGFRILGVEFCKRNYLRRKIEDDVEKTYREFNQR